MVLCLTERPQGGAKTGSFASVNQKLVTVAYSRL